MSGLVIGIDGRFLQDKYHGIGRYTFSLVSGLAALPGDHRVVLFIDRSLSNSRFLLARLARAGKVEIEDIALPLYHPRELLQWPRIVSRTRIDVVHSPYFWSPLLLTCPVVTTVHDMIFDRFPQYIPGLRHLAAYRLMSRVAMRRATHIIAVSDATRRDIMRFAGIVASKVSTVHLAADPAFLPITSEEACTTVRLRYHLSIPFVLAVGVRRPHKNIARLVSAFLRCCSSVPHSLVLVGGIDPRFRDDADEAIKKLRSRGRLLEIAHVEEGDLPALYSQADLFVQPSLIEGFGLPVLEAMSCGCPVACSSTSSLPEVAGNAAAQFEPRSEASIEAVLRELLLSGEERQRLRKLGLERATTFSWNTAAKQTLRIYRRAVAEP
jgi:glycosyltransferase involved in cell wall biosynthesis